MCRCLFATLQLTVGVVFDVDAQSEVVTPMYRRTTSIGQVSNGWRSGAY